MVNLIKIANVTYAVDIGFGGGGPTRPLPLCQPMNSKAERRLYETVVRPLHSGSDTTISLIQRPLYDEPTARRGTDPAQNLWVYEVNKNQKHNEDGKLIWEAQYAFTETEFLPADFAMMNYYTSTSPQMWFTYRIVCTRYLLYADDGDISSPYDSKTESSVGLPAMVDRKIVGQVSLVGGVVKRRIGETIEVMEVCKTEAERVKALEKWFGIRLTAEERRGIKGLSTELHGSTTTEGDTSRKRPRTEEGQVEQ